MTIHNLVTLSNTTATNVTAGADYGFDITVQNVNTSGNIYIGGEGVTSSNYGFVLTPGQAFSIELSGQDDLYLIGSTSGLSAAVLKFNLEVGQ